MESEGKTTRSPPEFVSTFEQIVKDLNPAYVRNKLVRGSSVEFLREVLPGVFASHNVLCKRGRYYHGFCITLHRERPTPYLISPLAVGGRFDHNNSAKVAYFRDVEPNKKWPYSGLNFSDSHSLRKGWEGIATSCTRVAEERILPPYMKEVDRCKVPVRDLLERLASVGEVKVVIERESYVYPCYLYPFDYDMPRFADRYAESGTDRNLFLDETLQSKPELFNKVLKMENLYTLMSTLAA